MKRLAPVLGFAMLISATAAFADKDEHERKWTFESDKASELPKGWSVAETSGSGTPAKWEVVKGGAGKSKQAVAITANKNYGHTFNMLIADGTSYKDLEIEVKVKAVAGKEDQGGGPVWHYKDANNYYVCRWNPLEDNIRLYFVKNGRRRQIASAKIKADTSKWHEIKVEQNGNKIEVEFDDKDMFEVKDTTLSEAGKVGLWVKADGRSSFDNFEVSSESGDDEDDD